MDLDRVGGQSIRPVPLGDFIACNGPDDAVDVVDRQLQLDALAALDGGDAGRQQPRHVQGALDAVVLRDLAITSDVVRHIGSMQQPRQVQPLGLPMVGLDLEQPVGPAHHFVDGAETEPGQELAQFLGHEAEEIDDMVGRAREALAQFRILRRHADRTGVEVAHPHHHAPQRHQAGGGKTELFRPQEGGDRHISAGLELAIRLDDDPTAQIVEDEGLMGVGQAQLPRQPGVLDARLRRRPGTAVMATDEDDVGFALGDAGGDRADTDFGDQLDVDAGVAVRILEVVDELGQILDGIDVVVRRR